MAKVKRYVNDGYVTSEDSNSGMKEARDAIDADIAKTSMMTRSYKPESEAGMMEKEPAVNFESTPKAKAPIVTKEQLAKSGLTLREYMNKQQGLKSRGETTPRQQINFEYLNTPNAKSDSTSSSGMSMKDKVTKEAIDSIKSSGKKYPDMSALQAPAKRAGMTAMRKRNSGFDLNSDVSYKQGGSVSSASRRADGIAMKGKTRGKMM
jgi:hypothetical protein